MEKKDRRIVELIRKDLNILERGKKCELKKRTKIDPVERKCQITKNNAVIED